MINFFGGGGGGFCILVTEKGVANNILKKGFSLGKNGSQIWLWSPTHLPHKFQNTNTGDNNPQEYY